MSAAVSTMQHQPGGVSNPASRMATSSPVDSKKSIKTEDTTTRLNSKNYSTKINQQPNPSGTSNAGQSTTQATGADGAADQPSQSNDTADQQNGQPQNTEGAAGDYFSLPRPSRLDQELNPFEQSFASGGNPNGSSNNNGETPKAILPPVTAMTSPALPLTGSAYNWGPHSLRSGPLSPAMLQGPTGASGGLGFEHIRSGLTPNESGIRSGLTPGGSGSMFPAPSPSTSQLFFGGATPGTMEFQKTALSAARKSHPPPPLMQSQSQEVKSDDNNNGVNHVNHKETHGHKRQPSDSFNAGPEHNAANGLFMLAQLGGAPNTYQSQGSHIASGIQPNGPSGSMESSPNLAKRAVVNNAQSANIASRNMSSSIPNSVRGVSEMSNDRSGSSQEPEPTPGRKGRNTKGKGSTTTGKRKNEDVIGNGNKPSSNKKSKASRAMSDDMDDEMMEDMDDDQGDGLRKDGKKMTDEEKRKNFLERNRVAALKCRQRKKQWLANLQAKVELYGSENDALNATVQALREEIVSLKTLLLAHKDCPVARANGVQLDMASMAAGGAEYGHVPMMQPQYPGMMPTTVMHQQQAADRRFS